jgi:hypothetical protein
MLFLRTTPGTVRMLGACRVFTRRNGYARFMFFAEPPPFDNVMADLRELEDRVNR